MITALVMPSFNDSRALHTLDIGKLQPSSHPLGLATVKRHAVLSQLFKQLLNKFAKPLIFPARVTQLEQATSLINQGLSKMFPT